MRLVDLSVEPGLRYTEEVEPGGYRRSVRYCRLAEEGGSPVGELEVHSFRLRFGAVAVDAEGIGGVEIQPRFRRRGHMGTLLRLALEGMSRRVDVATVSDGIQGVYEKCGFVTAVPEGRLLLDVRDVERAGESEDSGTVRAGSPDDLPAIVSLYNAAHACRPWTHERPEDWNRLPQATWRPGSGVRVVESEEKITGYAITTGRSFGDHRFTLSVDEMAAYTADAARLLLSDLAASAWRMRIGSFTVREPPDGLVGRLARHLGCHHEQEFPPTGEMMAAILNRNRLLEMLRPELRRREGHHAVGDRQGKGTSPPAAARPVGQDGAFEELARGALISEDHVLIRLLLGYVSATDALSLGTTIPDRHRDVCSAWFPGAACPSLPAPYAHRLDRY